MRLELLLSLDIHGALRIGAQRFRMVGRNSFPKLLTKERTRE
jgi:hypothetical protein